MTNFIPIFPLQVVVFPGEMVNLHIFEPRYKQLVADSFANKKQLGIPCVLNNKIAEYGTLVQVMEVVKTYEDGKMDIRIKGDKVFRLLEIIETIPDKLYNGAIVSYPDNNLLLKTSTLLKVVEDVRALHQNLGVSKAFAKPDADLGSYDVAHHAGLSLEEEYELLSLLREDQRLEYLKRHLKKVLEMADNMDALKQKIKLNGHFRELKGLGIEF